MFATYQNSAARTKDCQAEVSQGDHPTLIGHARNLWSCEGAMEAAAHLVRQKVDRKKFVSVAATSPVQ